MVHIGEVYALYAPITMGAVLKKDIFITEVFKAGNGPRIVHIVNQHLIQIAGIFT